MCRSWHHLVYFPWHAGRNDLVFAEEERYEWYGQKQTRVAQRLALYTDSDSYVPYLAHLSSLLHSTYGVNYQCVVVLVWLYTLFQSSDGGSWWWTRLLVSWSTIKSTRLVVNLRSQKCVLTFFSENRSERRISACTVVFIPVYTEASYTQSRNAWRSLTCSPSGIAVSPPIVKSS